MHYKVLMLLTILTLPLATGLTITNSGYDPVADEITIEFTETFDNPPVYSSTGPWFDDFCPQFNPSNGIWRVWATGPAWNDPPDGGSPIDIATTSRTLYTSEPVGSTITKTIVLPGPDRPVSITTAYWGRYTALDPAQGPYPTPIDCASAQKQISRMEIQGYDTQSYAPGGSPVGGSGNNNKSSPPPDFIVGQCAAAFCFDGTNCVAPGTTLGEYQCDQPFLPANDTAIWTSAVSRLADAMLQHASGSFILNCGPQNTGINMIEPSLPEWGYCELAEIDGNKQGQEVMVGVVFDPNAKIEAAFLTELIREHPNLQITGLNDSQVPSLAFMSYDETTNMAFFTNENSLGGSFWADLWNTIKSLFQTIQPEPPEPGTQITTWVAERINIQNEGGTITKNLVVQQEPTECTTTANGTSVYHYIRDANGAGSCYDQRTWQRMIRPR